MYLNRITDFEVNGKRAGDRKKFVRISCYNAGREQFARKERIWFEGTYFQG